MDLIESFDRELSAARHSVARVDREVDQARLELGHVHFDRPQTCGASDLDLDHFAEGALEEVRHSGQVIVEIDDFRIERLAPRESKQAMCQRGRAVGSAQRARNPALHVCRTASRPLRGPLRSFQIPLDDHQQVVEVVSDATTELAHGLQPLRGRELLLRLAQDALRPPSVPLCRA